MKNTKDTITQENSKKSKGNKFKTIFSKIFKALNASYDFCVPDNLSCMFCNTEIDSNLSNPICAKCYKEYSISSCCLKCGEPLNNLSNFCMTCKTEISSFYERARSPFVYKDNVARVVLNFKNNNKKWLAKYMAKELYRIYTKTFMHADAIVAVPIHKNKLKERGFNQSLLLAKKLGVLLNLPVLENVIIKHKETLDQKYLSKKERLKNLENSFKVLDKNLIKDKDILLLDDVFTTGATVEEVSKTLQKAGAKQINVLTFAHTLRPIQFEKNDIE